MRTIELRRLMRQLAAKQAELAEINAKAPEVLEELEYARQKYGELRVEWTRLNTDGFHAIRAQDEYAYERVNAEIARLSKPTAEALCYQEGLESRVRALTPIRRQYANAIDALERRIAVVEAGLPDPAPDPEPAPVAEQAPADVDVYRTGERAGFGERLSALAARVGLG